MLFSATEVVSQPRYSHIEQVQRRVTKFILNDYLSDYRSRLTKLELLPLMYWLDWKI